MTRKVFKELSKLEKIPHPKSRKTAQLTKKAIRSAARDKQKNVNFMKQNLIGEKFLWFKENIGSFDDVTPAKVLQLIERYLGRFDEELEQIQLKHTVGQRKRRQHASREDIIKMTKNREGNEFRTCGIEMPDLLNPKQLSMLMKWEGELRFLQNFKISRYSRSRLENLIKRSKEEKNEEETMAGVEVEKNEEEILAGEEIMAEEGAEKNEEEILAGEELMAEEGVEKNEEEILAGDEIMAEEGVEKNEEEILAEEEM